MKPVEIVKGIYWVGAVDWNVRDFHGYSTYLGSTYNAFLIMDETITLVDTVKHGFEDQMLERIAEIVDPKKIDIVISNHTEMDHSGGLPRVMHYIGEDKPIYCSKVGHKNLSMHYFRKFNFQAVENGGSMSLGKRSLTFLETRMLHWPDSMFSYCPEEKVLFSSDAFGQHYASVERFDDQVDLNELMPHAMKYYANIIMPYSPLVLKLLGGVQEQGLEFEYILPDHGIMWRDNPGLIVEKYAEWATQKPTRKAIVVFDTMWHSTEKMGEAIVAGLADENVHAKLCHLRAWHRSDVITELQEAGALIVGTPTLNNGMFPTVADFLCYAKGLKPKNKIGAAFGSHGWSGEGVKLVKAELEAMKLELVEPTVTSQFVPGEETLNESYQLGRKIGQMLPEA